MRWLLRNETDVEDWRIDSTNVHVIKGKGVVHGAWRAAREKPPDPKTPRSGWVGDRKKQQMT